MVVLRILFIHSAIGLGHWQRRNTKYGRSMHHHSCIVHFQGVPLGGDPHCRFPATARPWCLSPNYMTRPLWPTITLRAGQAQGLCRFAGCFIATPALTRRPCPDLISATGTQSAQSWGAIIVPQPSLAHALAVISATELGAPLPRAIVATSPVQRRQISRASSCNGNSFLYPLISSPPPHSKSCAWPPRPCWGNDLV